MRYFILNNQKRSYIMAEIVLAGIASFLLDRK